MKNFEAGELIIHFDGKTIIWYGKSIFPDPSINLNPYFDSIIPQMDKNGITIRFDKVKFLCSSTLYSIIRLIRKLNEIEIKTTIIYSKDLNWQRVTFKAFHTLSRIMKNFSIFAA